MRRRSRPSRRPSAPRSAGKRRVRLDRDPRAGGRATSTGSRALRPARARGRGRRSRPTSGPRSRTTTSTSFIVLKTAHYHEDREEVHFGEIHMFVGTGLRDHGSSWAGQRALHRPSATRSASGPAAAGVHLGDLGDPRQGRGRLPAGRRRDRGRRRGGRDGRLRRRRAGADRPHLQPEARGDRVPPRRLAAAHPAARTSQQGAVRARFPRSCAATSATSPTTPAASTSR